MSVGKEFHEFKVESSLEMHMNLCFGDFEAKFPAHVNGRIKFNR
jgi:hypothetical protein